MPRSWSAILSIAFTISTSLVWKKAPHDGEGFFSGILNDTHGYGCPCYEAPLDPLRARRARDGDSGRVLLGEVARGTVQEAIRRRIERHMTRG